MTKKFKYNLTKMNIALLLLFLVYSMQVLATELDDGNNAEIENDDSIVVVIDPGHGGENLGANYDGYIEKELTMATAMSMKEELEKYEGIKVYLTRENDVDMSLDERANYAKEKDADLFLCLHYNMSELHKLFGAECWVSAFGKYYAIGKDFSTIELDLLEKEGLYNRGIKTRLNSRGTDYYGVIRCSTALEIPAVLIEHCHLDQKNDAPFIDQDTWPQKYGVIDATAVAKYFGLKSDELGVDYSEEVHEATPIPEKKVRPDMTSPEWCKAELLKIDEKNGILEGKVSAYDPDSRLLYYTVSFDNGKTYGEYYKYEPDENGDVYFAIQIPNDKHVQLVICVLNMFGGPVESPMLFNDKIVYLYDVEEMPLGTKISETQDEPVDLNENDDYMDEKTHKTVVGSLVSFVIWLMVLGMPITIMAFIILRFNKNKKILIKRDTNVSVDVKDDAV